MTRRQLDTILGHYGDAMPWGMPELIEEIRLLQARIRTMQGQHKTLPVAARRAVKQAHREGWDMALDAAARLVTLDVCLEVPCLHQSCENDRVLGRAIRAIEYKEEPNDDED